MEDVLKVKFAEELSEVLAILNDTDNEIDYGIKIIKWIDENFVPLKSEVNGLLPCPFCGNEPHTGSLGMDKQNWMVWCTCGMANAEMGVGGIETKQDCIDFWNKRA